MQQQEMPFMEQKLSLLAREFAGATLWVREFRFYSDKNSAAPIRSIKLGCGLNIIWGDPSEDQDDELIGSGHAAGKSLFCRFLRYALGEDKFGNDEEQKAIRAQFPYPYILVEVMIRGEAWLVKRPLEPRGGHQCQMMSMSTYDESTLPINWKHYNLFTDKLNELVLSELGDARELISFNEDISWLKLLPWLSRDQECRLNHLANWRENKTVDRVVDYSNAIIRAALKLNNSELKSKMKDHDDLKRQLAQKEKECDIVKTNVTFLESHIQELLKDSSTPVLRRYQTWGELSIAELNAILKEKRVQYETTLSDAKDKIERQYREVINDLYRANSEDESIIKKIEDEIAFTQFEIDRAKGIKGLSQINTQRPSAPFRCNTPIIEAINKNCPCRSTAYLSLSIDEGTNIEEAAELIRRHGEKTIKEEYVKMTAAQRRVQDRDREIDNLHKDREKKLRQINVSEQDEKQEIDAITYIAKELKMLKQLSEKYDSLDTDIREGTSKLTQLSKECDNLRKKSPESKLGFTQIFYDLMKKAINPLYECELNMEKHRIRINLLKHNSEAMKVASILVFDCASLLYSLTHPSALPGFLMHDSPREADLSGGIFNKILSCLPETLEEYMGLGEMPFQYIVTTTTKPKESLMKYLKVTLRANNPQERLLKCDF